MFSNDSLVRIGDFVLFRAPSGDASEPSWPMIGEVRAIGGSELLFVRTGHPSISEGSRSLVAFTQHVLYRSESYSVLEQVLATIGT